MPPSAATTRMKCAGNSIRIRLVDVGNAAGASPLHRAAGRGVFDLVLLLLDRGANVHAVLSSARGLSGSFWTDLQAIDLAIWDGRRLGDPLIIQLLLERGATRDLKVAAALGETEYVRQILDARPERIRETRPSGRRPLSAALEAGHERSRVCCSNAAQIRTGPSPRHPRAGRCTRRREPASMRWSSYSSRVALIQTAAWIPPAMRSQPRQPAKFASFSWLVAERRSYDTNWIDDEEDSARRGRFGEALRISAGFATVVRDGRRDQLERMLAAGLRAAGPHGLPRLSAHTSGHAPDAPGSRHEPQSNELATSDVTAPCVWDRIIADVTRRTAPSNARPSCSTPVPTSLRATTKSVDTAGMGGADQRVASRGLSALAERPHKPGRR